jgi:Phage integrase family
VGLDLRGPHDLRHTFATWLEDDGIPTRVIDELMGHAATRQPSWASERGSPMGAVYRHTTAEMEARVVRMLDARLAVVRGIVDASDDGRVREVGLPRSASKPSNLGRSRRSDATRSPLGRREPSERRACTSREASRATSRTLRVRWMARLLP